MSDTGQVIVALIVELLIMETSFGIDGKAGFLIWILSNALLLMFCYYQDKVEKQQRREKKRVRMFADGRASAYENKEAK